MRVDSRVDGRTLTVKIDDKHTVSCKCGVDVTLEGILHQRL